MEDLLSALKIEEDQLENICLKIDDLIQKTIVKFEKDGAVLGLSGGMDSAVTAALAVRALGAENVHLLNLPERDSKNIHKRHALNFASQLGISLKRIRISPILRIAGAYRLLPIHIVPSQRLRTKLVLFGKKNLLKNHEKELLVERMNPTPNSWIAKGNAYAMAKHRIRMLMVYKYAELHNLMVIGAANYSEWLTGTFSKWGVDHCADVMPILHLYRTQVEQLARYLQIPGYILEKPADPDIMPGVSDKGDMLGGFKVIDQILVGIQQNKTKQELILLHEADIVDRIFKLYERSEYIRSSPYSLLKKK